MPGSLSVICYILILAHPEAKGHSKESISVYLGVECCEEGTGLTEMAAPTAVFASNFEKIFALLNLWGISLRVMGL